VEQLSKVHAKQLFTYLKLKGLRLGFVLSFGSNLMKDGIERVVDGLPEENLGVLAFLRRPQPPFRTWRCSDCGCAASVTFRLRSQ